MGKLAVEAAIKHLQGEEIERIIYTDCEIVDKDNAYLYLEWH